MTWATPLTPDAAAASQALIACYRAIVGDVPSSYVRTAVMDNGRIRQEWTHHEKDGSKHLLVLEISVGVHREAIPDGR